MSDLFPWLNEADDQISEPDGVIVDPTGEITLDNDCASIDQPECDDDEITDIELEPSEDSEGPMQLDYLFSRAFRREENHGDGFDFDFEYNPDVESRKSV